DDLAVAQTDGNLLGLELNPLRERFDDRGLADARLADEHGGIGALAVAENFQDLPEFPIAAEHGRELLLPRQEIQIHRKVAQDRRQLEPLLQTLVTQLEVAYQGGDTGGREARIDAVLAQDRHRNALLLLEERRQDVGRRNGRVTRPAGVVQG